MKSLRQLNGSGEICKDDKLARRSYWIKARKTLLQQVKVQVRILLGRDPEDIENYTREYKSEFKGHWQPVGRDQLMKRLFNSRLVLSADFHAFAQSQRANLRLLRGLPQDKPLILAMECFEAKHQKYIDLFLRGKISERIFLRKIAWESRWGFPWSHYRPLIELARRRQWDIVGLNKHFENRTDKTLHKRDEYSAGILSRLLKTYPEALVYVIFGDLHLAAKHLPKEISKRNPGIIKESTLIFQNSEELYFRLAESNQETDVDTLCADKNKFCLLESPPWVKWQSYLLYLEQTFDHGLEEGDEIEYTDTISSLIEFLSAELRIKITHEDLAVYSPRQDSFLSQLEEGLKADEIRSAEFLIASDRSFLLTNRGAIYLSRPTINHAASVAGQYIHAKLSKRKHSLLDMPKYFLPLIWVEAVGFFFSKLINHRRKAENFENLRAQLASLTEKGQGREILALSLERRMIDLVWLETGKLRRKKLLTKRRSSYLGAAKVLGHILGDRLFEAYREKKISRELLLRWLKQPLEREDFELFYLHLARRLEPAYKLRRIFGEKQP